MPRPLTKWALICHLKKAIDYAKNIFDHVVDNKTGTLSAKHGRTKDTECSKPQMSQHCESWMFAKRLGSHIQAVEIKFLRAATQCTMRDRIKNTQTDRQEMVPGVYVHCFALCPSAYDHGNVTHYVWYSNGTGNLQ